MRHDVHAALFAPCIGVACEGHQSALHPRGPQAERLFDLFLVMTIGSAIIFVAVMAFLLAGVFLPKHANGDPAERHARRLLPVGVGTGMTVVVLIALLLYSVGTSRALTAPVHDPLRINVVARQWWWDVTYPSDPPSDAIHTANELHIPIGRPVEVTLESPDVIHSFWVPNLHGKMDAIPGRQNRIVLTATEPGLYRGQCAEFCGLQHAKMAFLVVAESPESFAAWLVAQRRSSQEPTSASARHGREVFLTSSCVLCHTVRGTPAMAKAGPDLTHLASRLTLAAGVLPLARGQLGGWIVDPQHIKPGAFMPPNDLRAGDLHAVLDYLESLP